MTCQAKAKAKANPRLSAYIYLGKVGKVRRPLACESGIHTSERIECTWLLIIGPETSMAAKLHKERSDEELSSIGCKNSQGLDWS